MNKATAESLGDKLATLDLTEDEATTLALLIGGRPVDGDAEVSGFNIGLGELQETAFIPGDQFLPGDQFRAIVGSKFAPPTMGFSFGVEREM